MVQLADRTDILPAPTDEPFHRTLQRLIEVAERAWMDGDAETCNAAIGQLVLYTNNSIPSHSNDALEALLLLCVSGVAKPASLAHVGSDGRLAKKTREFAQRFWRAGNPRPEDLLMLALGHGLVSQTALGWNVPDEPLAARVREKMRKQ